MPPARRSAAFLVCAAALAFGAALVASGCYRRLVVSPNDAATVLAHQTLEAPDPALPGSYAVRSLYYGSGTDRRRAVYRDSVTLRTGTVDASPFVDLGKSAKERNGYWGFTPKAFPLNGRVWYPDGPGPYPLVLIVHGNHDMKDYSDPGYAYLGELLASRGFILASVDENFLNGSIRGENDGRGWMLLKHLELFRGWDEAEGNPFYQRVDMDRIAIMGHSRGGEAVAHAASFNRLSAYPDDANVKFDFHFHIRSVVAIAPVDGQYDPAGEPEPVRDVNYLVFHGSHDGDVSSFMGLRQYHRVRFTDGRPHFKAAVYVYRANHGQWNTIWGPHDNGPRSARILDLRGLLRPEQQRQFAKVYIGAFLEATLHDDARYLPLFRDHRVAGQWLPKTMYITRFQDASFRPVADFEEDVDPGTGSVPGVRIEGDSLSTWKEGDIALRWKSSRGAGRNATQDNQAVWLGWNDRYAGADTTRRGRPASYTIVLPDSLAAAWRLDAGAQLQLLLAPTDEMPGPRALPKALAEAEKAAGKGGGKGGAARKRGKRDLTDLPPIDLSVELLDADGDSARVPLDRYGAIRHPLVTHPVRRGDMEREEFARPYEYVLQTYTVPLSDFRQATSPLDLARLRRIRLVFDRAPAGTVILDGVGFARLDPAFMKDRLPSGATSPVSEATLDPSHATGSGVTAASAPRSGGRPRR